MKVHVDHWRAIGYWVWDIKDPDDVCGICQNNFDATCATCKTPGPDCALSEGQCTHIFHLHCISEWLRNHDMCPMCKRPWTEAVAASAQPATAPAQQQPQANDVQMENAR